MSPIMRLAILTACAASGTCAAQTSIDPSHPFSWQENTGWMNWYESANVPSAQSVLINETFLSGNIWCENIGWITLGDGSPANATSYSNASSADAGVNLDLATGNLSGYGWGENIGWINFGGGALASPPNSARLDTSASRLRGYAWSENIGWVNLDDLVHYVGTSTAPPCPADFNQDGGIDGADVEAFFLAWENGLPEADVNADGGIDGGDVETFFIAWENGGCD